MIVSGPWFLSAFLAAAALLVVAGAAKLRDPGPAGAALATLGLPGGRPVVTAAALLELAVGVAGLLSQRRAVCVAVGCLYLVFACVIAGLLRRRAAAPSCGCLGGAQTPPSFVHLGFDLAATAIAALEASDAHAAGLLALSRRSPVDALLLVGCSAAGTYLAAAVIVLLPGALRAYRSVSA